MSQCVAELNLVIKTKPQKAYKFINSCRLYNNIPISAFKTNFSYHKLRLNATISLTGFFPKLTTLPLQVITTKPKNCKWSNNGIYGLQAQNILLTQQDKSLQKYKFKQENMFC